MLRIKRNNLISFLIVLFLSITGFLPVDATFKMAIIGLQLFTIIAKAKISFLSIFTFLINFCVLQQYIAYIGGEVYGLLGMNLVPIYFEELCFCTYCFNLLILGLVLFTKTLENEKRLLSVNIQLNEGSSIILLIAALVLTILIFPSLPSLSNFSAENRYNKGIISFTGWSIIPYFFLAAAFANNKIRKLTITCVVFVVFWYAFHGERVEAIGFIVFLAISYYKKQHNRTTIVKIGILGGLIIILFIAIGIIRNGVTKISIFSLINSILIQATACDVTHVFNCAVDGLYNGIQFSGTTYLSYLINCIPFLDDPYSFATQILNYYDTVGGGLFFAEPIANFGFNFSTLISFIYLILVYSITKKPNKYNYLLYCISCISVFRTAWYGLNYPIIATIYFIPFVLLLDNLFKKRINLNK